MILCVDVMEHIEKDELVFSNFYKALVDDGILLVSTPSDKGGSDVHHDHEHHEDDESHSFMMNMFAMAMVLKKLPIK